MFDTGQYDPSVHTLSQYRRASTTSDESWRTTSADEWWSVDGVSLNRYAWAVSNFGGSPRGFPGLRGSDPVYAYRAGQAFRPKVAASRTIVLEMYVNGLDPDTNLETGDSEFQFNQNWEALQRLFWTPDRQVELTRRWRTLERDANGEVVYRDSETGDVVDAGESGAVAGQKILEATARAQIGGAMEPEMTGRNRATFSVDLVLSDPFFYGPTRLVELFEGMAAPVFNAGSSVTTGYGCSISIFGANPSDLRFTTTSPLSANSHWFQYEDDALVAGERTRFFFDQSVALRSGESLAAGTTDSGSNSISLPSGTDMADFTVGTPLYFHDISTSGLSNVLSPGPDFSSGSAGTVYYVHSAVTTVDNESITVKSDRSAAFPTTIGVVGTMNVHRADSPVTGKVSSYGNPLWLSLQQGANTVTVEYVGVEVSPDFSGQMFLSYREPYV